VGAKGFELAVGQKVDPKALGAELRRLRVDAGVPVTDLAERMGWIPQNISRLERGGDGREPTISSVNLYVRMLGYELLLVARPKKIRTRREPGTPASRGAGHGGETESRSAPPGDSSPR
jgi:transcriptional regulator with XRE-family HTH domain